MTAVGSRQRQLDDVEVTTKQNGRGSLEGHASEVGIVGVVSQPAPDAEDRLRRLCMLRLKPSSSAGQAAPEKELPRRPEQR